MSDVSRRLTKDIATVLVARKCIVTSIEEVLCYSALLTRPHMRNHRTSNKMNHSRIFSRPKEKYEFSGNNPRFLFLPPSNFVYKLLSAF